ncbi:MAG: hypothetical protein IPP47_18685 [Bryobacterales bacterium]|nr:hypothetical protein [Bryobacterales bacterium]
MIPRACIVTALSLIPWLTFAGEPKLYKLRFREGAEYCAVARTPEDWKYTSEKWPDPLVPGNLEVRKDPTLPSPGYLIRWNGEYGIVPPNYSPSVFRFEWTGAKPEFFSIEPKSWESAPQAEFVYRRDSRIGWEGKGDAAKVIIGGKRFERTGKRWTRTDSDTILSMDANWLVLQSGDGPIVHHTIFGPGPDRPLDGLAHIDVFHVPSGQRRIRLEVKQTDDAGLDSLFGETRIFESQYLFIRVDTRPLRTHFLVCKLPVEP